MDDELYGHDMVNDPYREFKTRSLKPGFTLNEPIRMRKERYIGRHAGYATRNIPYHDYMGEEDEYNAEDSGK